MERSIRRKDGKRSHFGMVLLLVNTLKRDWKSYGFSDWETTEPLTGQGIEDILDKTKRLDHYWIQPEI